MIDVYYITACGEHLALCWDRQKNYDPTAGVVNDTVSRYFSGHGSGSGPVYHSVHRPARVTTTLLVDGKSVVCHLSGSFFQEGTYSYGVKNNQYAFKQAGWWYVMDYKFNFGWDVVRCYKLRLSYPYFECQSISFNRYDISKAGITHEVANSGNGHDMLVQLLAVKDSWVDGKFSPIRYAGQVYSLQTNQKKTSPRCPYLTDYQLAVEFGGYGIASELIYGFAKSTESLVRSLPQSNINAIEAAMDVCKIVKGDVHAVKGIADVWLSYRYSFTTTKLDIASLRTYLKRLSSLSKVPKFTSHGRYSNDVGVFTCSAEFSSQSFIVNNLSKLAEKALGQLNLVNLWDIVPWSFAIDWLIPIGDFLDNVETSSKVMKLRPRTIWYSYKGTSDSGGNIETTYLRFSTSNFLTTPYTLFDVGGASNRTKVFRSIDAVALILGR